MRIQILAFGIAKDILRKSNRDINLPDNSDIKTLKDKLISDYPDFEKLASLRIAVNTEYADDDYVLKPEDEVVIIPPVSGG